MRRADKGWRGQWTSSGLISTNARLADAVDTCAFGGMLALDLAMVSTSVTANRFEIAIGRTAAACAHPVAAWYSSRRSLRVILVAGYFAAGFAAVLATLLLI
jgi:hypothetical protein